MTNNPQSVSTRYLSNLLAVGENDTFFLESVIRLPSNPVDFHYSANVFRFSGENMIGNGVTPLMAVKDALSEHGVTFR